MKLMPLAGLALLLTLSFNASAANTVNANAPADTVKNFYQLPGNPYPALPANVSRLFYVQRTPNANTIVYELKLDNNGLPDEDEPIHPYWIRYTENGKHEELGFIQRKFAYGLTSKSLGNGRYDIRFVSYKKLPLTLMKGNDGKYHIFATISQKQIIINRIFVRIEGGSFWVPNVRFVEIKGTDPTTNKEVVERFKP
ncbi:DUF4833 domain-containing protein [Mucilaginibacter sp. Bleaf8]|uniref:DUF4833 domain-containing protein n=1 Tax=Mucilaginibacter sp. Bleaf8 TaxID=2834430 RepID=UPI001BCE08D7|nr:DUF4833 domain-containing protein [Mucilaginibacter sp. Bleaf8]MBS7563055.1 DUF4833 domain-containing protein [Mucilaginibacter sp. Bleaf8]